MDFTDEINFTGTEAIVIDDVIQGCWVPIIARVTDQNTQSIVHLCESIVVACIHVGATH